MIKRTPTTANFEREIAEDLFNQSTGIILTYCRTLLLAFEQDEEEMENSERPMVLLSDLYEDSQKQSATTEDILRVFADYFNHFYPVIAYYISKEQYENAKLIKDATDVETGYVIERCFMGKPTLRRIVVQLKKKFTEHYL